MAELGIDVAGGSPEALRAYIKSEIPKWAEVVKASGATVNSTRAPGAILQEVR